VKPNPHFSPEDVTAMIDNDGISSLHREHANHCPNCSSWLRAFAAVASMGGKKITFLLPPSGRDQE
jgi:hypothetical protein